MNKKLELFWPLQHSTISQKFGDNDVVLYKQLNYKGHNGIDLPCQSGTPIYASHDGIVMGMSMDKTAGCGVMIRTNEEYQDRYQTRSFFKTIYWHTTPNIPVRLGQQVRIGDIIAYSDNTGYSTGPHLHWGLKAIKQGENEWDWITLNQNNGYGGALNPEWYVSVMSAYQLRTSLHVMRDLLSKIAMFILLITR